jgi:asparagine synthase (glutamine-hydrolysing)
MTNEDETIWITFNGEIYNFQEIRQKLEGKGHTFHSHSDTEVVVHLYEELGTKCLDELNGMFAFALWDAKLQTLFLARDRIGKKPLHYCVAGGHFVFASEIKALLQHPMVSRQLDFASLNKKDMLSMVQRLPEILDEPLADPSILPLYLLSQFASTHMKVVLSGDGGDELFAGYQTYQAHKIVTFYDALPGFVKESIKALAFHLPVSHRYLSLDFKLKQFLKGVGVSSEVRFFLWRGAFSNAERSELLSPEIRRELHKENAYEEIYRYVRRSGLTKELERILYLSMKLYLQDNNLVTVDRASMANGLEVRSPLLDRDVAEFVCRLPMEYKLNGLRTKYILKKAAEEFLPRNIVYRKKKGFGVPLAQWLAGDLREFMLDYLSQERIQRQGIFHYPYIKQLIDEQVTKTKDNREPLWTLLVFQTWYEKYMGSQEGGDGICG